MQWRHSCGRICRAFQPERWPAISLELRILSSYKIYCNLKHLHLAKGTPFKGHASCVPSQVISQFIFPRNNNLNVHNRHQLISSNLWIYFIMGHSAHDSWWMNKKVDGHDKYAYSSNVKRQKFLFQSRTVLWSNRIWNHTLFRCSPLHLHHPAAQNSLLWYFSGL